MPPPSTRSTGERRAGTVGIAFPGQQIRIVDAAGTEVPTGVDGAVLIAGPNVMRGYLGRPDETARVIVDGWLHTGDIGHLDERGLPDIGGAVQGHDHPRRGEHLPQRKSRTSSPATPPCWRPPSSAYPTTNGAKPSLPTSNHDPAA